VTLATRPRATEESVSSPLVEEALRALTKAFRAWQLYLPNNPTRERAVGQARDAFAAVWAETDEKLRLQVREAEFALEGQAVFRETERQSDGIPWILYRDGVREITILPGFEHEDLSTLLGLLQRARQAAPDDDDLVTMLWVADLETLTYRYVEVASAFELSALAAAASGSTIAGATAGEAATREPLGATLAESPSVGEGPPSGIVRVEDFDSTLYFLDQRELAYLQEEVRAEFGADPRREVLAILFDLIEVRPEVAVRREVIGRIEELLIDLLATGAYDLVAYALRESGITARRAPGLEPAEQEALLSLTARLSDPTVVAQLLQAVDEGTRAPRVESLELLVGELRGSALGPLLAWLAHAPRGAAQTTVERAVLRLAERQTGDLVRLLEDVDPATFLGAIRVSGQLRLTAAVPAMARLLRQSDAATRAEVVSALAAIGSPGAMQAMEPALDDEARDVRLQALRAIGAQRYAAAMPKLTAALKRRELRQADRTEKTALFDAFGAICGDGGVPVLDGVLNGRSLLGPRESSEMRACAARALALVGTPVALAALRKASDTRDAVVRNEVARGLRGSTG
jgi:HEAT repeat protein